MNKCKICNQETSINRCLLKIEGNWYCFNCLLADYFLLRQLRPFGYWYKTLKRFIPKKTRENMKEYWKTDKYMRDTMYSL